VVHLAAQTINMDIHDIGCGINPHPPDVVQNHGAGHHATFIPAKILQKRKLLWSQLQQVIAPSCFTTHQIKVQVGSLQTHRFILWNRGQTSNRLPQLGRRDFTSIDGKTKTAKMVVRVVRFFAEQGRVSAVGNGFSTDRSRADYAMLFWPRGEAHGDTVGTQSWRRRRPAERMVLNSNRFFARPCSNLRMIGEQLGLGSLPFGL